MVQENVEAAQYAYGYGFGFGGGLIWLIFLIIIFCVIFSCFCKPFGPGY
ncbi:MAG: hypothetical protein QHH10_04645 [Peptococcaceae bacterium]|jgi:hypothetical protein|nr:hypothetical protein [Peptococcaceae bacterium]MDH7524586.1 hypothetical protein [Peptococcaceae bacterium]